MKCSRARDRFQEYIEGTLKGGDLRALEEHLETCEVCSRELNAIRELDARLRQEVPAYWESVEPSPGFISRLRTMKLEPETGRGFSFMESILGLWQNHRVALSGGLAVCLIIALALAIPALVTDNGDETAVPMVAESAQESSTEESFLSGSRAPGEEGLDAETTTGIAGTETPSPTMGKSEDGGALGGEAEDMTTPPPVPTPPPEPTEEGENALTCGEVDEGYNAAIEIALDSEEVQNALQDQVIYCVEVPEGIELEGYICSGSTVAVFIDETEPLQPEYYVCVNVGSETVTAVTLADQP